MRVRERASQWKRAVAKAWGLKLSEFRTLKRRPRPPFSVMVTRVPNETFDGRSWMRAYVAHAIAVVRDREVVHA